MKWLSLLILAAGVAAAQTPTKAEDPVLTKLTQIIGGTWTGEVQTPNGPLIVEFKYRRHPDGKGIIGEGQIGKGSKAPIYVTSFLGWDPTAKQVYYLDTHGSESVFYGHVTMASDTFIFEFGPIGGDPKQWKATERFTDKDTLSNRLVQVQNGEEKLLHEIVLKRQK
jgi:hypothetical protein